jgi:hypothetical protein
VSRWPGSQGVPGYEAAKNSFKYLEIECSKFSQIHGASGLLSQLIENDHRQRTKPIKSTDQLKESMLVLNFNMQGN